MSSLKTFVLALPLAVGLAGPLAALSPEPAERAQIFAACLGRYSAEMEHDWLVGDPAEGAQSRRKMFEMLLTDIAAASGIPGSQILDLRIRAKMAQAQLLQAATFNTDPERKRRAQAAARLAIRPCELLIIA